MVPGRGAGGSGAALSHIFISSVEIYQCSAANGTPRAHKNDTVGMIHAGCYRLKSGICRGAV